MPDSDETQAGDSAEKAYAAAAEAVVDKTAPEETVAPKAEPIVEAAIPTPSPILGEAPVEFPAKPKRASKPTVEAAVAPVAAEPAPVPVSAIKAVKPPRARIASSIALKASKPASKPAPKLPIKRAEPVRKIASPPIKAAPAAVPKIVAARAAAAPKPRFLAQLKELPMDMTASIKDAVSGAQEKAKEAFTKTSAAATEATEFAKGNVEAMVESGKILASGLQELGNAFVAESKTAFETATADVKALSGVKSPTDFFKLQTALLRRNFDTALAYGTKTGEAMVKLGGEAIAPLTGRVTLAVEKVKKAA